MHLAQLKQPATVYASFGTAQTYHTGVFKGHATTKFLRIVVLQQGMAVVRELCLEQGYSTTFVSSESVGTLE